MKVLRSILIMGCFCLLLPAMVILGVGPASSQGLEMTADDPQRGGVVQMTVTPTASIKSTSSTFEITLAELDYEERILNSPYGTTEYTLRLPEGWELREGSFFDLDVSYTYNHIGILETEALPPFFGDIIVVVDSEAQLVFPIEEATLGHSSLRIDLPLDLFNDPDRNVHSIRVTLDASIICEIPHKARLIIHPTSFFSLPYDQLPITTDLARYPRPFYQRALEPDQVRFVLPAQLTERELSAGMAVAAKLGDIASRMAITGITDLELINRLEAGEASREHLIVMGKPESNGVILKLNQLGVLPVPLRARQLILASEGPATVAPAAVLSYTLTLTNSGQEDLSSLSLVDTLPDYVQVTSCSPSCSEAVEGEVSWPVSLLGMGDALSYTLELRLSEFITDSVLENTTTLLDAAYNPINVNTLTTTVSSMSQPTSGLSSSVSEDGHFFVQGERAVPEGDGIVQEIVSPWDQTRAILIITGLSDEAVYKASRAMSSESYFPGMEGPFALVRQVRPLSEFSVEPPATDFTFADLGYSDRTLQGYSQEAVYSFDLPFDWRLTETAYLDLRFSHSQLLDYGSSFLNVLFNNQPIATVALSDETSLNGQLKVELSPSQARPGQGNRISIQTEMSPLDRCVHGDMWLLISSASLLHLDHEEQDSHSLYLDFYPYPFDQRSDLADVLFVLPPEPRPEEWEEALSLAAALGAAAGGPTLAPAVILGYTWPEAKLHDYHLIAIGRPSRNPMLQQVNARLPQPFQVGSDEIEQRIDDVVFRLAPGLSLGFVQLIPSPWTEERAFLAVTGTTDESVKWAVDVLAGRSWALKGNLALIRDSEVSRIDTRGLTSSGRATAMATAVPEMTPVAMATATPPPSSPTPVVSGVEATSDAPGRPAWLIPLVGVNGLAVLSILAFVIWRARKR